MRNWFPNRRPKTYTAISGYVYRYVFEGVRNAMEYVFTVSAGPTGEIAIVVLLSPTAIEGWARANRELNEIELYGIAKLALFRAFDDGADPASLSRSVQPAAEEIAEFCVHLDF